MKKRKFIGFMTVLIGLPGLGAPLILFIGELSLSLMTLLAIGAFVLRGLCGTIGGVLLWKGSRKGYILSSVCWGYMIIIGVIAFYQLFFSGIFVSFDFTPENKLFWSLFGKSLGKLLWGIPFIYLLLTDLKKNTINFELEESTVS